VRAREPVGERGLTTAWPGGEKDMQDREGRGNGPYKGPLGSGGWVTRPKVDVVRRKGKEYTGRNWTE
jgi:hypothetical protein